jgi:hypothetical protein
MSENPLEGEIFARNYLRPNKTLPDSSRARRRALSVFGDYQDVIGSSFASLSERNLGVNYPYGAYGPSHEKFWTTCDVQDFLGAVTLVFRLLQSRQRSSAYIQEMRDIFQQEGLHYRIDDKGGVHYLIDEEFSRVIDTTLLGLGAPRFAAARMALETGMAALETNPKSGKAFIRGVFEAAESTFLVLIADSNVNRLNEDGANRLLKPILVARYRDVPEAEAKISRVLDVFNRWIKAAHPYRHGAAFEEIHEAPLDEAVLLASTGMAFIRYMVSNGVQ